MRLPVWAVFGAAAAGCSLIIPLDYVGGGGSSGAGSAGTGHAGTGGGGGGGTPMGGTSNGAEAGAGEGGQGEGGSVTDGGSGARGGSDAGGLGGSTSGTSGTDMGGTSMGAIGGSSMGGDDSGGAPPEGGAGNSAGGTSGGGTSGGGTSGGGTSGGGTSGGGAGSGGKGGRGGMGGTAGCSFDLTSNPLHCGSCTTACPVGNECIDSKCVSSPCDELGCGSVQQAINNGDGPRKDSVGTTNDVCVEVLNYTPDAGNLPAINCWNVTSRIIEVNKVAITCGGDKALSMPKRKGGYCFHALPGDTNNAGFVMPQVNNGCCKVPTAGSGGT